MSGDPTIAERFARSQAERPAPARQAFLARMRAEPLLPDAGAGGGPLTAAIAVMSFLAGLALAALFFIFAAAGAWTSDLKSGVTVQIKGADSAAIALEAAAALKLLQSTDGVVEARAVSPEESARLLEPWLGEGNVAADLNVPALIEARVAESLRADLEVLETKLKTVAPGAVVDDHGQWHERLTAAARSGEALAVFVFLLVLGAGAAIAAFAARAGLAANGETVAILHLVGATDAFIANEVQRRFLALALRGSIAGICLAFLALGLASFAMKAAGGGAGFLPTLDLGPRFALALLIVPAGFCLVTAVTARLTALRTLSKEL